MNIPLTREEAIAIIDKQGKRQALIDHGLGECTPEEYFDDSEEPMSWFWMFDDLQISYKVTKDKLHELLNKHAANGDFERCRVIAIIAEEFLE